MGSTRLVGGSEEKTVHRKGYERPNWFNKHALLGDSRAEKRSPELSTGRASLILFEDLFAFRSSDAPEGEQHTRKKIGVLGEQRQKKQKFK